MKYYIYKESNNSWNQVHVEIEPKYVKAFDTTNDTLSCVLRANNDANAYLPMTAFKIVENGEATLLWIVNDTVDVFSQNPLKYKHTLSLVQYRYFLQKHLIRNTVFNQPRKNKLQLYAATSNKAEIDNIDASHERVYWWHLEISSLVAQQTGPNYWSDKLALNNHTKVKAFSYYFKVFAGNIDDAGAGSDRAKWIELYDLDSTYNIRFVDTCYFSLVDANNSDYELKRFYISELAFAGEIVADDTTLETINTYVAFHQNAYLVLKYWNSAITTEPPYNNHTEFAFVEAIDSSSYLKTDAATMSRYRFITVQLYINLEIYNYTMWDVIDILLKQNRLKYDTNKYKRNALFYLPSSTSELGELLRNTYPVDTLSFTQCTFYDALTEIFRYFDAGFKFDESKTLQIEYYNNPLDKIADDSIEGEELNNKLVGKQISHSERNFNSGRIAYYQNAILPIKIPRLTVRSQSLGVPNENDFGILLEKSIYNMGKLYVDVWSTNKFTPSGSNYGFDFDRMKLDLTTFVMNQEEYTVLDKIDPDGWSELDDLTIKYQASTLHFNRGGNFISLSETYNDGGSIKNVNYDTVMRLATSRYFGYGIKGPYGVNPARFPNPVKSNYDEYVFSIEYLTMNNGRSELQTTTKKYNGQQIVNQDTGIIDLNKLGLNILGESLKDGEPVLTANCIITNWSDRIKEGDYFIDEDGAYWVANVVNYTEIAQNKYRCSVEFSKNFNALSLRVQSDKEKRLTNVSSENTTLSEDNFVEYVYITRASNIDNFSNESITLGHNNLNYDVLASMIAYTFKANDLNTFNYCDIRFGIVTTYDLLDNVNEYGSNSTGDLPKAEFRYIPILKYGHGNCICFEMQFKDSLSAGNMLTKTTGWFGTNKWFSSAALYTDDDGWADKITINFCDLTEEGEINDIGNYPVVNSTNVALDRSKYVQIVSTINKLEYYKKPNEIFALNYEWCFLIADDKQELFIGNKFINENFFTNKDVIQNKTFYLRYLPSNSTSTERYSILDTKGIGTNVLQLTGINLIFKSDGRIKLGFKVASTTSTKIWAIVDENNDIYFASNIPMTFNNYSVESFGSYQLGIFTSRTRKDY